ncbi:MAG: sodium:calcium exchanger, partial [Planctomycetota bacterium]
ALVLTPVGDPAFYLANYATVAVFALVYATALRYPRRRRGFSGIEVLGLVALYLLYVVLMLGWTFAS